MKKIIYEKLVRDKIPQIIVSNGQSCATRVLTREEYLEKLDAKLTEELIEYQQSKDIQELADLLEVVEATAKARGCSWESLLAVKAAKREKRGGFDQRILLESVTEE